MDVRAHWCPVSARCSASAWPGQACRPAPNGAAARSTRISRPSGAIRRVVGTAGAPSAADHPTVSGLPRRQCGGMNTRRWIAIGLAAVTAAAAATTATAATAATTPAQHAYLQQDLQRDLDAITATGVPGVLAEVRTGARQLRGTSGVADLDSGKPVNGNGFFR